MAMGIDKARETLDLFLTSKLDHPYLDNAIMKRIEPSELEINRYKGLGHKAPFCNI